MTHSEIPISSYFTMTDRLKNAVYEKAIRPTRNNYLYISEAFILIIAYCSHLENIISLPTLNFPKTLNLAHMG
jgi:hypothetical protein